MRTPLLLVALASCVACHRVVPPAALPAALQVDAQVYAFAPAGIDCQVSVAPKASLLREGSGTLLGESEDFRTPVALRVRSAQAEGGWLLVRGETVAKGSVYLRVPAGQAHACLTTDPQPVADAVARIGKTFAYTPWSASCQSIQAVGSAPSALLVESDPGVSVTVARVKLGAGEAAAFAKREAGGALWYEVKQGLSLRSDTLEQCFTEQGGAAAAKEPELAELLQTPLTRCTSEGRGDHVECRSTLGVWEGTIEQSSVSLRRSRRTLGSLHFFGGRPVAGGQFARTVVAFRLENSDDNRVNQLSRNFAGGVRKALAQQSEGELRLARGDETGTHQVSLRVTNLRLGELSQRDVREATRYKSGQETLENPEKSRVEARVQDAESRLRDAERDYEEEKQRIQEQNEAAIRACNEAKEQASGDVKKAATVVCTGAEIAATLRTADKSMLQSAQQELSQARQESASTPATITQDIMSDWTYTKHVFEREAAASLQLVYTSSDGASRTETIPFQQTWSDWEAEPDPAHGVEGHRPERAVIDNPDAILAPIGQRMSQEIAKRLTIELQHATLDQARKAFLAAGNEPTKPGYEDLDAEAFSVAGTRLSRVKLRSRAVVLPGTPVELPTSAVTLGAGECLLAVAVAERGQADLSLLLGTAQMRHGDVRKKAKAVFEVCPGDLGPGELPPISLAVADANKGAVRWALYTTLAASGGAGGKP